MARILLCEPHADIRSLLTVVVRRLGHEPVVPDGTSTQLYGIDAIVLEPGDPAARELAAWAREHVPTAALICTSIYPSWAEVDALHPDAYLVKPFPLFRLEAALGEVLAARVERAVTA